MRKWTRVDADGFRGRVQELVRTEHGGSQKRAARAWRMHQTTLNRFLNGKTSRLGVEFAKKIARYHNVTMDWLVNGEGEGPSPSFGPREERDAWLSLVQSLGLSPLTGRAVELLPTNTGHAFRDLTLRGLHTQSRGVGTEGPFQVAPEMARAAWDASMHEYLAWTSLLQGMLDAYGKEAVVAKLEAEWSQLALGYQGVAVNLLANETISRQSLETEFAHYDLGFGVQRRGLGSPSVPPLESKRHASGADRMVSK